MTQREFFEAIIKAEFASDKIIDTEAKTLVTVEDVKAFAQERINHLDTVNSNRRTKSTPKQKANAEMQANIIATIDKGVPFTGKQVAEKYGISAPVATAICGKIVKAGYATVTKERVEKGKSKVNVYTFTAEPIEVEVDETETED